MLIHPIANIFSDFKLILSRLTLAHFWNCRKYFEVDYKLAINPILQLFPSKYRIMKLSFLFAEKNIKFKFC